MKMATPRKKPEDLLKRGRPSLYKPEYCDVVVALGKDGNSLAAMCAHFDVTRSTIDEWASAHPDFSEALARARIHAQKWWEDQGRAGMHEKGFNAKVWEVSVRARFREDYTERKEVETKVRFSDAPSNGLMAIMALAEKARGQSS